MGLKRIEGWEARLAEVIEGARKEPYLLGKHDCLRVALLSVNALTGENLWPNFEGKYSTRHGAKRLLASLDQWPALARKPISIEVAKEMVRSQGSHFDAAFSFLFDTMMVSPKLARRGDICKYSDVEDHLGVCIGARVAVLNDSGLSFVPLPLCGGCWRIG